MNITTAAAKAANKANLTEAQIKKIKGTGKGGKIGISDVRKFIKSKVKPSTDKKPTEKVTVPKEIKVDGTVCQRWGKASTEAAAENRKAALAKKDIEATIKVYNSKHYIYIPIK